MIRRTLTVILRANSSAVSGFDEQYADLLHEVAGNYEEFSQRATVNAGERLKIRGEWRSKLHAALADGSR